MSRTERFSLREFGLTFATRGRGEELREELLARMAGEDMVEIDFAGVTSVSYSFADEFFGVLAVSSDAGTPATRFVNVEHVVDRVVRDAISRRRGEPVAC